MEILIKIYRADRHPLFPDGGKLTPYLELLQAGALINIDGPHGKFSYSRGFVNIVGEEPFAVKKLVMVAGGSGIAPIYNVINEIVRDKEDPVEIVVLCCHKTVEDILLKEELEKLRGRIKVYYMIDQKK